MKNFTHFGRKKEHFLNSSCNKSSKSFFHVLVFLVNPFWIQLSYFITFSLMGYLALKFSKPKSSSFKPKDIDIFFTSVSATTVSSMSTVEMEVFSNTQLIIMTILMLVGGEVFISMLGLRCGEVSTSTLGLQFARSKFPEHQSIENRLSPINIKHNSPISNQIELSLVTDSGLENKSPGSDSMKYESIKFLCYVVLGYLLVVHVGGASLIFIYVSLVPSARDILKSKGLQIQTFSVFTTVSTFTNCGFVPTNENMIVFKKNSGLLLLLIPQILLGNTLYPPCLRLVIWLLEKITKRMEFNYMLRNSREMGYSHLLSSFHSSLLAVTVLGFILVQFVLFCVIEWNSEIMNGLNSYEKIVSSLFQIMNSRNSGESVFDLSIISPAILVLFIVMMYLPPYTSFLPARDHETVSRNGKESKNQRKTVVESLILSQLSYLVIFIILICITESKKMKEDPLNFNVLNITIEVISAYGNVGFSTGYSCKRQLKPVNSCKDKWYGFAGRWSNEGKFLLILVMFFGRLKKFNMKGGKNWKLS